MIAKLHIETFTRNEITQLGNCYFSPPLKVMNITEDKLAKDLHLMIMSSSPGILDRDGYELKVDVAQNCSLQLHTQSYQRLFDMQKGATQKMEVYIQKNASFIYLPHPTVPHKNSIFATHNKIYLNNQCSLIWGEVLTCGRKLNDEVFQFSKHHNITEIFLNNKLIIKENLLMQPSLLNPNSMGQLEGFTHQASFIYFDESIDVKALCDKLYNSLSDKKEISFGVSTTQYNSLIIRILGYKAEQLYDLLKEIAASIQTSKIAHYAV